MICLVLSSDAEFAICIRTLCSSDLKYTQERQQVLLSSYIKHRQHRRHEKSIGHEGVKPSNLLRLKHAKDLHTSPRLPTRLMVGTGASIDYSMILY